MHTIADIIKDREVYFVSGDKTVKKVVDYLCEHRISAVPVKDGNEVVGVFTERDLVQHVVHKGLDPNTTRVRDVMSKECLKVSPEEDYRMAKAHMLDRGVRHLVVTDLSGQLLGHLSMRHLIRVDVQEYAELVAKLNDRYYQDALRRSPGE